VPTQIISIKTSQSNNTPASLANGELAYSYSSNKLYIGQTDTSGAAVSVEYIGGKLLVDKVANLESTVTGSTQSYLNFTVSGNLALSSIASDSTLITAADGRVVGVSGTNGQVFQVASNGTPTFGNLDGGSF
jgi:hypothetical protein